MQQLVSSQFTILGQTQHLALVRLLMRNWPDRVTAERLAHGLGLEQKAVSTHLDILIQDGLVTRERVRDSLQFAVEMDAALEIIKNLPHDCCRGRPSVCLRNPYLTPI
jgi:arsenate reductase